MDQVKFDILINATPAQKALMKFANTVTKVVSKVDRQLRGMDKHLKGVSKSLGALNGKSMNGFNKGIIKANKNLSVLERRLRKIGSMSAGGGGGRKGAAGGGNRFASGAMGLVGGYAAFGLMGMISGAVGSGNEFESKVADIKGILANAEGGFGSLDKQIREVGRTSAFTINQMGDAAKFMAMAGMNGGAIGNTLSSVSNLGMVGNLDAGRSADIMTNIMASMGIDSKQSGAVTDVLTATFTNSNTSINELGQSFAYVGNIAAQTGTSINETAAAIGILGNAGIKGSRAGTNLRQMFLRLAAPTKDAQKTLNALGLNIYRIGKDGHRALKPMADIIDMFKKSGAGLPALKSIFGVRGGAAFSALIGGAEKYKDLLEDIAGSGGLTEQLAEKKMATTAGKTLVMKSKWEDLSITLMDKVRPAYNYVIDGISKLIDKLQSSENFLKMVEDTANWVANALKSVYEVLKFIFNFIVNNGKSVSNYLTMAAVAMSAFAASSIIASLANPFAAAIIGAMTLMHYLDKVTDKMPMSKTELGKSNTEDRRRIKQKIKQTDRDFYSGKLGFAEASLQKQKLKDEHSATWTRSKADDIKSYWKKRNEAGLRGRAAGAKGDEDPTQTLAMKLKAALLPKTGEGAKLLTALDKIWSTSPVNLDQITGGTNEGDAVDTMSKASPLTSSRNEMSRSVIVNMNSLVENVNINGALGSDTVSSEIEAQVAELFTKVVSDFELGMSH